MNMDNSDVMYRFRSKSQHILNISLRGRKIKVKFTTPYNGLSRYNTSDAMVASQIRLSLPFKSGMIQEEAPVQNKPVVKNNNANGNNKNEGQKLKEIPAWMKRSVKVKANDNVIVNDSVNGTVNPEGDANVNDTVNPEALTQNGPTEQVMFGIKPEEVETYMDAKQYVRDVLGAEVTKREEVMAYCKEHDIVFPNFSWE